MSHFIRMLIGCVLPFLLIFAMPLVGIGEGVTLVVFIVLMFACHTLMVRGHHHEADGSNGTNPKMKGNDDAHT